MRVFSLFLSLEVFGLLYVSSFGIYSNEQHAIKYYVTFGKNELDLYQQAGQLSRRDFITHKKVSI